MLGRKNKNIGGNFAPQASYNTQPVDEWSMKPEQRTGIAFFGQENLGAAATSRVMDSVSGFMGRDNWGPSGRVARGVE